MHAAIPLKTMALACATLALCACQSTVAPKADSAGPAPCAGPGAWIEPDTGQARGADQVLAAAARRDIVLLGESHTSASHHLWQLQTLAGLYAYRPRVVLGFEMLPRSTQPALDRWVGGQYNEDEFLAAVEWYQHWGYDPAHYLPLFRFARLNRQPAQALNVDRGLVMRVGDEGWDAIPAAERQGLGDPAPATEGYRLALAEVYRQKLQQAAHGSAAAGEPAPLPALAATLASSDFQHFVQAQLTWDRAMAEALLQARRQHPGALVVGIMGRGHVDYGYGVPHQLAALGDHGVATLVPVDTGAPCTGMAADLADAVFTVPPEQSFHASPPRPRLGVALDDQAQRVTVLRVSDGSVAQSTGLRPGDVIASAAGSALNSPAELVGIIARQPWGTWLPLEVVRDGKRLALVARFPPSPHRHEATAKEAP